MRIRILLVPLIVALVTSPLLAGSPAEASTPDPAFIQGAMATNGYTYAQAVAAWNDPVVRDNTMVEATVEVAGDGVRIGDGAEDTTSPCNGAPPPCFFKVDPNRPITLTTTHAYRGTYAWARYTYSDWLGTRAWFQTRLDWTYNGARVANPVVTTSHGTTWKGALIGKYHGNIDPEGGYIYYKGNSYGSYKAKREGKWDGNTPGAGFTIWTAVRGYRAGGYTISGGHDGP